MMASLILSLDERGAKLSERTLLHNTLAIHTPLPPFGRPAKCRLSEALYHHPGLKQVVIFVSEIRSHCICESLFPGNTSVYPNSDRGRDTLPSLWICIQYPFNNISYMYMRAEIWTPTAHNSFA
jgi:hypothetical protein